MTRSHKQARGRGFTQLWFALSPVRQKQQSSRAVLKFQAGQAVQGSKTGHMSAEVTQQLTKEAGRDVCFPPQP